VREEDKKGIKEKARLNKEALEEYHGLSIRLEDRELT